MYKLYCYGDNGDYDEHYEIERETIIGILEYIKEQSWFLNWVTRKLVRSSFIPIRLTEIKETHIMDQHNPQILKAISDGKEVREQKELKQLEELKKKYENSESFY